MRTGRALGSRYELLERLGGGAMGDVWRTWDRTTDTEVAAKLLRAEYARDPQIVARFVQERAILLTLRHPHIVEVRDLVVEGDDLAIVMELVRGRDLRALLRERGTLPAQEAVAVSVAVLRALEHAHAHGCLHRDVKPDNILLDHDDRRARLSDFGIARLAQETTVRATGALGTPDYMAPEVFVAEQVSAAADVYAAGIQLYELLAGRTPFGGGGNAYAVVNRHVTAVAPPLPGLPDRLASVLAAMLAKEPARRLSAGGAATALGELLPELAEVPALALQAAPERWEPVLGAAVPSAYGVRSATADSTLDAGETALRGIPLDMPAAAPVGGTVAALAPRELDVAAGETMLGGLAPAPRPTLRPAVEPASRRPRLVRRLVAAAAVLVVAGAAAGLVVGLRGHRSHHPRPAAATAADVAPVTQSDSQLPTGLTVTRVGTYDARTGRLSTAITWQAGRTPLAGPFYEDVPAASCEVAWSGGVTATPDRTDGITAPCGFKVAVTNVAAHGRVTASYDVELPVGRSDPSTAVGKFLDEESRRTTADLSGLAQSTAYPVQRLEGVDVVVPSTVVSQQRVAVRLLPQWAGVDAADNVDVLFDTTAAGPPSTVLQQVAGGLSGVRLSARSCGDAIGIDVDRYPYTTHQATGCVLAAQVGDLDEATSSQFDIGYRSG